MNLNKLIPLSILSLVFLSSCSDDDDVSMQVPIDEGVGITMRNTLQDPGGAEASYPSLFGQPDDAYDETSTLSNSTVEFATALAQSDTPAGDVNGLYRINFTENTIEYELIAAIDDPFWSGIAEVFGVTPSGKFDRYYFTFSEPHNISNFTSNNSSVNLRIDSDSVIVVEIGEGFDVTPGEAFTIVVE